MKITNNNLRAAKRLRHNKFGARIVNPKYFKHIDSRNLFPGVNGINSTDLNDSAKRTHEKSQKRVNDKESDPTPAAP